MDNQNNKPYKPKVPLSDACEFYLRGFDTHASGLGQIKVTNRPPQFGVFFDGTGNNFSNDIARWDDDKEPTNVSKLFLLYPIKDEHFISKTYIPGIGTEANRDDSDLDMGMAYSFGDKVREGIDRTKIFFRKDEFKNAPIGILDIFGFSRGAAAARHFVNEVHRLNKQDPKYFGGPLLQVRFLGLFDTVGSIGMAGDNSQKLYNGESFILDVNPNAAQYVYHLTARHEHREYFPLSSILTAAGQAPGGHFEEVELPGAHADVGGGYGPVPNIVYYPVPSPVQSLNRTDCDEKIKKLKREYEQKYHAPGVDITMQITLENRIGPHYYSHLDPRWNRSVRPQLAHAALLKMHTKSLEKGVPFEPLEKLIQKEKFSSRRAEDVYAIPSDLQDHLTRLESNPLNTRIEDYVYQHYVHHSNQYRSKPGKLLSASTIFGINGDKKETSPHQKAPNGKREVFYNITANGHSPCDQWKRVFVSRSVARWVRQ